MENRFLLLKQMLCAFLTLILCAQIGYSQSFVYTYNGPDTIFVDGNCEAILDWGDPATPTATSNLPGCALTTFTIFSIADNMGNTYPTGVIPPVNKFTVGDIVTVTHQAMDDCGNNAFFGFQIEFVDNTAPTIDAGSVPADVTVTCSVPATVAVTGSDNCDGAGLVATVSDNPAMIDLCVGGTIARTYTITDASGNASSATQNITVSPNGGPVISAAFLTSVADVTIDCASIPVSPILTVADITDDCTAPGSVTIIDNGTENTFPGAACPTLNTITRLWTIEDACGAQTSHLQTITVQDNTAPVINPVAVTDITINCNGVPNDPETLIQNWDSNFTVNDDCGVVTWSNDYTGLINGTCFGTGTASVTYTANDGCNSSSVTLNFTVQDFNPPNIIMGAQDITVSCDGMGNVVDFNAWLAVDANAIAQDVCSPSGNVTKTIEVPSDPSTNDPEIALANAVASGCSSGVLASVTVEFTYTDACGNFSTTDADFVIVDASEPIISVQASNQTVECDGSGNAADLANWLSNVGGATATDACTGGAANVTWRTDPATPTITNTCGNNGSVTVDFYATDACGNELPTPTTATFFITDNTAPTWTTDPSPLTIECDGTLDPGGQIATWLGNNGGAVATDGCSPGLVTISNNYTGVTAGCGATGSVNVLFTAEDGCGNTSTRTVTLTIEDTTPPVWTANPSDVTIECDGAGNAMAISNWLSSVGNTGTANDGCSGSTITFTNNYSGLSGTCGAGGAVTVTFTATDDCGLTATETATLTVNDSTNPTITTPASTLNVECGPNTTDEINAWLAANGNAVATDACGMIAWSNDYTGYSAVCPGPGTALVNFEAKDACGNTTITSATVNVMDTQHPVIYIDPTNVTIQCDDFTAAGYTAWLNSHGGAFASDECTTIDNSSTSTHWSYTDNYTALCTGTGFYTVQFTVTDECGLTATKSANYSVVDNVSPEIIPTSTTVFEECGGGDDQLNLNAWIDNIGGAVASDGCSNATWVDFDFLTNDQFPVQGTVAYGDYANYPQVTANKCDWEVQVQFRVTDECNNTSTTTSKFIIEDDTDPTIAGVPADVTVTCSAPAPAIPLANDNCDASVTITMVADTVATCANEYVLTRTWTATDDCGNSTSDTQVITVEDNDAPMVAAPADVTVECDNVPAIGTPTVNDACDANPTVAFNEDVTPGACANEYLITRTWTVTDACGNTDSDSQIITVTDNTQPQITGTLPADVTVECNAIPTPPVSGTDIIGSDNCGLASFDFTENSTQGADPANCDFYSYTITRSWVATDNCNNSVTHTQTITVEDNSVPTFTTPANITVACEDAANNTVTGTVTNALDACGVAPTVTFNDVTISTGSCAFEYTVERTWTVSDPCNNTATGVQTISVIDNTVASWTTLPQDVDMGCTDDAAANMAYNNWLTNYGFASAVDNCGTLTWYVLEPGSYDINDPSTFTTAPVGLASASCPSGVQGVYRQDIVSFVVVDECGNALEHNASFIVSDNAAPVFTDCPTSVTLNNDPGICGVAFNLEPPLISDECNSIVTPISVNVVEPITSPNPGDDQTIVNPVVLNIGPLPMNPAVATDPVTLQIDINNFDGEEPTEFFAVYAEDNSFVGNTAQAPMQCGNSTVTLTVTAAQLNAWIADDGFVTFNLLPNVTVDPIFAINDICPQGPPTGGGSTVSSTLQYNAVTPSNITYGYSIDGAAVVNVPLGTVVPTTLDVGSHTIQYFATDCAGNQSSCSYSVDVIDNELPTMGCPSDVIVALAPGQNCSAGVPVDLQPPTNIFDNCGFQTMYSQVQPGSANAALITYSYNPNYLDYVADDKSFTFFGTGANAVNGMVTFTVRVEGDVEGTDEYFEIFGEDGSFLGTTQAGQPNNTVVAGTCPTLSVSTTTISVPVATFNAWAADGQVSITAESFDNFSTPPPGITGDGISPACVVFANGTPDGTNDGMSNITVILDYTAVTPTYYATGATTIANSIFPVPITSVTHNFNVGVTDVVYQVEDVNGNVVNCTFTVTVEDNNAPSAVCQGATIFVSPDGTPYTLDPMTIDGGSFDDCSLNNMSVSPSTFDCSSAGSIVNVTLTVTDDYGNSSSCIAPVNVQIAPLQPTASTGLCGNLDLDLFANAPTGIYTYQWTGPNGFTSFMANPTIPTATAANSGTYTVIISSTSGCTASGDVIVNITGTPTAPSITVDDASICSNQSIVLNTQAFSGSTVNYTWYEGTVPTGAVIGTTTVPVFSIPTPTTGNHTYYVVVEIDGCTSDPSGNIAATVSDVPNITAVDNNTLTCADGNGDLILMPVISPVDDGSYVYTWTGPNGFSSASATPTLLNVTSANSGSYTLTVTNGAGCTSNAYTQVVSIDDAPDAPVIASQNTQLCEGSTLQLNLMNTYNGNTITYNWITPQGAVTTTVPTLNISPADAGDTGNYSVSVDVDGCPSAASVNFVVNVNSEPAAPMIASNGPLCEGESLDLSTAFIPGASYFWTGPNNFNSSLQNPTVSDVSSADAGNYFLFVTVNGCTSQLSTPLDVVVNQAAAPVAAANNGPICLDGGSNIELTVTSGSALPGATYTWYNATNGIQIGAPTTSLTFAITDLSPYPAGAHSFYVIAQTNGCPTPASIPTTIILDAIPASSASAGADIFVCDNAGVTLNAVAPSIGSGTWTQTSGVTATIANPSSPNTAISGLTPGQSYTFQWSLSNGACLDYSSDEVVVNVDNAIAVADAGPDQVLCNNTNVTLAGSLPGLGITGTWTQPAAQALLGVSIVDPSDANTAITGLMAGNNFQFIWTYSNIGCGDFSSDVVVITIGQGEGGEAFAGNDFDVCADEEITLGANGASQGSVGVWTTTTNDVTILSPNQPNSFVVDLQQGDNEFIWSLSNAVCGTYSQDTVVIYFEGAPDAIDDTFTVGYNGNSVLNILSNDAIPGGYTMTYNDPSTGTLTTNAEGNIVYTAALAYVGTDQFVYEICSDFCPEECTTATVTLNVGDDAQCQVPSIFTPNNDGINDAFIVPCLSTQNYPNNEVAVFNQWGDEVFRKQVYQNDWLGTFNGEDLPTGTYFYVVNLGDGNEPMSGFLVLER